MIAVCLQLSRTILIRLSILRLTHIHGPVQLAHVDKSKAG